MLGRRGWEYRSIANNLAILHTLAVFVSFSCASVILFQILLNHLNQSNYKKIREEIASVRSMLLAPNYRELLNIEIKSQLYESEKHKISIRVTDRYGRIINQSSGIDELLPKSASPASEVGSVLQKFRGTSGNLFQMSSAPFIETNFIGNGQILIVMDISDDEKIAKEFMIALIMFSLFGLLFAVFSAHYIIGLGLKPLNDISEIIKTITESNLDTRLDVTLFPEEIKSMGNSFNIMLGHIETFFNKLSQYSENLAHELRTPLNNLILEAGVTLSRQRTLEEYQQIISSSMEEYDRLSQLIDRLLFLVRADNNQLALVIKQIDVVQELENVTEFYSEALLEKGVTVTIVGAASLKADVILFNRAVSNLFSNALNHMEQGGTITLAITQNDSASVDVSVQDTGSGIDPVLLPKIFDRYFWIESTRKKDAKGIGLGLDIVKTIMKLHGGSVEIQSELGRGTTVKLTFPLAS